MKENDIKRKPHAILDAKTRTDKAFKIHAILKQEHTLTDAKVLEIGTGSGIIAHELSKHVDNGEV